MLLVCVEGAAGTTTVTGEAGDGRHDHGAGRRDVPPAATYAAVPGSIPSQLPSTYGFSRTDVSPYR